MNNDAECNVKMVLGPGPCENIKILYSSILDLSLTRGHLYSLAG